MANSTDEASWISTTASAVRCKVSQQVSSLRRQCGNIGKSVHPEGVLDGGKLGDVHAEPRQWRAFENADLMEQGLAAGLVADFMELPVEELRMRFERSPDRKEFLLSTEDGSRCLLARGSDNGFNIFIARDGEPPIALGPMFQLVSNGEQNRWTLSAVTCDHCEMRGRRICGTRDLAHIRHHKEYVQQGEGELHCMDVEIPRLSQEGGMEVWCPMCRPNCDHHLCTALTTRRPKWNPRLKTLNMNFFGRVTQSSAKNFQLELVDKPDKIRLLFGKVAQNKYVLDFKGPLNMVQAFAAAVSTSVWH
jgi:hypothetical protein